MRQARSNALLVGLVALILATAALANENVENRIVRKRIEAMAEAAVSVDVLAGMIGSSVAFDSERAAQARKRLVRFADNIPGHFRRARTDPLSRARPDIWQQWRSFKDHANLGERAARALKTRSRDSLAQTLPAVIESCNACHRAYRKP